MNFPGNFKKLADVNVGMLKDLVLQLTPEHWAGDATHQKRCAAERGTQMIGLVYDFDFRHTSPTKLPPLELFAPACRQILADIADFFEAPPEEAALWRGYGHGYFIRTWLQSLSPGAETTARLDKKFSAVHSHRMHVPVITNDRVVFTVGRETINLCEGEIFEINNRREHSVRNDGGDSSVHLVLDWVNGEETCCCSRRLHPGIPCSPEECRDSDLLTVPCNCFPDEGQVGDTGAGE